MVKNLPAMQGTWVLSMCREDLLEKEMASHSSVLAWRIPWTEEPGRLQLIRSHRQTRLKQLNTHTHTHIHTDLIMKNIWQISIDGYSTKYKYISKLPMSSKAREI